MEYNPRLDPKNLLLKENKIILGSFPTWTLTGPDIEKQENLEEKEKVRKKKNDLPFFFGSSNNQFWNWYKEYVDDQVCKQDIQSIQESLKKNQIGITDVIMQCSRKERSSLDKHLTKRTYNHSFFNKNETIKILCTSKGVMNEMLLNRHFFSKYPNLKVNTAKSEKFQLDILSKINGNIDLVRQPFYNCLESESGSIECISIPSPGSPYRKLNEFGQESIGLAKYLDSYLSEVFSWFQSSN